MWPNPQSKPQFPLQCICNSVPLKIPYPRCLTGPQIYPHKRPPHVFCKTRFIKFTEKQLCWSLFFNKVVGLKLPETCNFIKKKRLQHSCFLCEFCKSLKYTFFTENFPAIASLPLQNTFSNQKSSETIDLRVSVKRLFWNILQTSQEMSFLVKFQAWVPGLIKNNFMACILLLILWHYW